jgi:hypothetical protein
LRWIGCGQTVLYRNIGHAAAGDDLAVSGLDETNFMGKCLQMKVLRAFG